MKFYTNTNQPVEVQQKEFISAKMRLQYFDIYKKYESKTLEMKDKIEELSLSKSDSLDIQNLSPEEYETWFRLLHNNGSKDLISYIFKNQINKELVPVIFDSSKINNIQIKKMFEDMNDPLWLEQNSEELDSICETFCSKVR